MTTRQKKLTSNLLFGGGVLIVILGILVMLPGFLEVGLTLFAIGIAAALAGIVVGFVPARRS